jgi:hypothetical protein
MKRLAVIAIALAALLLLGRPSSAQGVEDPSRGEPSGVRESARTLDVRLTGDAILAARTRREQPQIVKPDMFVLLPAIAWADGLTLGGVSGAYVNNHVPGHPIQVRGGYRRLAPGGSDDLNQVSLDGKVPVINLEATRLTPYAEIKRVLNTSRRARAGVAFEQTFAKKLTLGANVEYANAKRDQKAATEDLIPAVGVTYAWSDSTETSIDYTFNNEIDEEYDISFTLSQQLWTPKGRPPLSLVFGVARHRTVFISIVKPFSLRAAPGQIRQSLAFLRR